MAAADEAEAAVAPAAVAAAAVAAAAVPAAAVPAAAVELLAAAPLSVTVNYKTNVSTCLQSVVTLDTHVDHVVDGTVLGNGDKDRLMVGGSVDRRKAVRAGRETRGDICGEDAVLRDVVETLEEGELGRVRGGRLVDSAELLNDDVRVALDVARGVHLLRRGEVVLVRVHEVARLEVVDGHRDGERRVGLHGAEVLGERELGRGHVRRRGDDAHRRGVARTGLDLQAVGDGQVGHGGAEVDEVVRRGERCDLAGFWYVLAVVLEASREHRRVKR